MRVALILLGAAVTVAGSVVPRDPSPVPSGAAPRPAESGRGYRPPVSRPVADPFRAPPHRYGPGNRGLEYATEPGDPIGAIGEGAVTFAGQVAGRGVVVVRHPDGLRSSSTGLLTVAVSVGDRVEIGQVLGTADRGFHLGVRRGEQYVDPAALFGGARAVLVPVAR